MKVPGNVIKVSVAVLAAVSAILAARFVGHAADPTPAIRVDSSPIDRDPHNGNSYAQVIKKVAPSVVNIYSTRFVKQRLYRNPLMADPLFRQFFGDSEGSREVTRRDAWLGCGIVVAPDGYILTANHVVDGADEIRVEVQNDKTYSARVVGLDPPTDVAILKIEGKNLPAVTLGDSDQLEVGDVVLAIGNPFGIGQTVTRGIISALGRSLADVSDDGGDQRLYQSFIQTDAAINEGNSGGALVDTQGRLIGINDAIVSPSGTSAGIGFAVPINMARNVMDGFLKRGRVARGYLGVEPQDIDAGLARGFGAPNSGGALLATVIPGTPAAKAGLASGDIIVAINDKPITSADNLIVTIAELTPGAQARVEIYRNGAPKTIIVTLGDLHPDAVTDVAKPDANSEPRARADAMDGVAVQDLTPRLRRQLRAEGVQGALVNQVDRASNSFEAGLRWGDVIQEINRQPVANAADAQKLVKAARSQDIVIKIWRPVPGGGGNTRYISVDNTRHTS
jgi:serine protease Do